MHILLHILRFLGKILRKLPKIPPKIENLVKILEKICKNLEFFEKIYVAYWARPRNVPLRQKPRLKMSNRVNLLNNIANFKGYRSSLK